MYMLVRTMSLLRASLLGGVNGEGTGCLYVDELLETTTMCSYAYVEPTPTAVATKLETMVHWTNKTTP